MAKKVAMIDVDLFRARQALNQAMRGLNRQQILEIINFVIRLKGGGADIESLADVIDESQADCDKSHADFMADLLIDYGKLWHNRKRRGLIRHASEH